MRSCPLLLSALALLALGALAVDAQARPAKAEPPATAANEQLREKAQELLTEGNHLAAEGDFGGALIKYRTAHELYPTPKLLLNIGTALRHIGRNAEAAAAYEAYLAHPEAEPARETELREILDEIDAVTGHLDITIDEPEVRVSLDGDLLRDFDEQRTVRVDPGPHSVVVEKEGRTAAIRRVHVAAGQTVPLEVVALGEEAADPIPPRRIAGTVLGILGLTAIGAGGVVGIVAASTDAEAEAECADTGEFAGYCTQRGAELAFELRDQGTAATLLLLGGAITAGAGLTLLLTEPELEGEQTAAVVLAPWGLQLVGRW